MSSSINITFIRLLLILSFYLSNIFTCNCSNEKNVIVRSNREYDYFGNVLEYEYDYFASYSSTSTPKVLVRVHEYDYSISAANLMNIFTNIYMFIYIYNIYRGVATS